MKKVFIIALALITAQFSYAQDQRKGSKLQNLTADEIATLQTKKMTLFLDLNKSQQDDIYKINLENAKLRKSHIADRKAKKESGTTEKPSKEERLKKINNMLDHKIAMKAKMKNILNEEQYTRWEKAQMKKFAHMKKQKKGTKGKRMNKS